MAVRARADNLGLDHPAEAVGADAAAVAFEELWAHRDDLRMVSRRIVGDDATADDVVQDTYLRALTAERLDRRLSFAPWLATVARRRSIDRVRATDRARLVATLPDRPAGAGDDPLEQVLQQERAERVRAALGELTGRERQILLRQLAHGLSLAELAAEEATSIASVRSVLARARTKLRLALERGGPLGAAPVPRLVTSIKRRLHRLAARFEGSTPMLAAGGSQLGDAVVAVMAAAALLLGGSIPASEPRATTTIEMAALAAADHAPEGRPPGNNGRPHPGPGSHGGQDTPGNGSGDGPESPRPVAGPLFHEPPPVDLPGIPPDAADQPEEALAQHVAASADGRTLVITGIRSVPAGSWGGEAFYRSDDGGATWRQLKAGGLFTGGRAFFVPGFSDGRTFFVSSGDVLYRTNNGGEDFLPVASSRNGVTAVSPNPADGRIFLAPAGLGAYDPHNDVRTPYTATPWSSNALGGLAVRPPATSSPEFLVGTVMVTDAGRYQGYVQRCTTGTCAEPYPILGLGGAPQLLQSTATPDLVLAWFSHRLYRSTDGGQSFAAVPMPPNHTIFTVVEGADGELWLAMSNRDNATASGLLRSVDGGATWTPMAVGTPLQQGAQGLAYLPGGRLVVGLNDLPGFRCSVDNGATWTPRCPTL